MQRHTRAEVAHGEPDIPPNPLGPVEGARAHADLYLVKPFSPEELRGAVKQALGIT